MQEHLGIQSFVFNHYKPLKNDYVYNDDHYLWSYPRRFHVSYSFG